MGQGNSVTENTQGDDFNSIVHEATNMDNELSHQAVDNQENIKGLLSQLEAAVKEQNSIIEQYKCANKQLSLENKKKETNREFKQHVKGLEKQLTESRYKIEELEKSKADLTKDFDKKFTELNNKYKEKDIEISRLKENINKAEHERDVIHLKSEQLLRDVVEERDMLHLQNKELKDQLRCIMDERDSLKQRIDTWIMQKHKTVHVQMYAAVNKQLCDKMMDELEGMLSIQFELTSTLIQVEKYQHPPPKDSTVPLIVICINASRLGTDVNQALSNVSHSRTLAVVVLHHKEIHALPKQPSEKLLFGSEYKHINAIVDIAYLTTKGIYPCDMNEKSLDRLVDFIKSNSHN